MTKFKVLQNRSDVCLAMIGFNVGCINEPARIIGISHLLEHLLFTTSKNSFLLDLRQEGYLFNAITTRDITYFYIQGPSSEFQLIIDMLLKIVRSLTVDKLQLENEKRIVIEEFLMPGNGTSINVMVPFLNHTNPYRNSVIGNEKSINSITLEDLYMYYEKHYVLPSCVLHIDKRYIKSAEVYFRRSVLSRFPSTAQKIAVINMNENFSIKRLCLKPYYVIKSNEQVLLIGFATVPYNDVRKVTLELFAFMVSHAIFKKFREEHGFVYKSNCSNFFYKYTGVTVIQIVSARGNIKRIIPMCFKLIHEQVRSFQNSEFQKLKKGFLRHSIQSLKNFNVEARHHLHDLLYDHPVSYTSESLQQFITEMTIDAFKTHIGNIINFDKCRVILYSTDSENKLKHIIEKSLQHYAV